MSSSPLPPSLSFYTWRAKKRKKWRTTHLYFTKYILGLQDRSTFQFFFHFRVCPPIRYAIIYRLSARHKFRPIIRDLAVRYTLSTLLSLSLPSDTFRGSKDSLPTLFYSRSRPLSSLFLLSSPSLGALALLSSLYYPRAELRQESGNRPWSENA